MLGMGEVSTPSVPCRQLTYTSKQEVPLSLTQQEELYIIRGHNYASLRKCDQRIPSDLLQTVMPTH